MLNVQKYKRISENCTMHHTHIDNFIGSQSDTSPTTLTHTPVSRRTGAREVELRKRGICQTRQTAGTRLGDYQKSVTRITKQKASPEISERGLVKSNFKEEGGL